MVNLTSSQNGAFTRPSPTSLPAEMIMAILEEVGDKKAILKSRLISKTWETLATPVAFRTLSINRRRKSMIGFIKLANTPELASLVEKISFKQGSAGNDHTLREFLSCVSCLSKFPNLSVLAIYFPMQWKPVEDDYFFDDDDVEGAELTFHYRLSQVLAQVHSEKPLLNLTELELHDLPASMDDLCSFSLLTPILENITRLYITTVTQDLESFDNREDGYCCFWDMDVPRLLKDAGNLTSLTIISDVETCCDLDDIPALRRLEHLKLVNFVFSEKASTAGISAKRFVEKHAGTLQSLDLSGNWLNIDTESPLMPKGWASIFKDFQHTLTKLRHFKFEPLPSRAPEHPVHPELGGGEWNVYTWYWVDGTYGRAFYKNIFIGEHNERLDVVKDKDILAYNVFQHAIAERQVSGDI